MGHSTQIQWCDHTYNPWRGCRRVADECKHCYITTTVPFRTSGQKHGADRVRAGEDYRKEPLRWNKKPWICDHCGLASATLDGICPSCQGVGKHRARVFTLSLGDWLDDENVDITWFVDLLWTIYKTPNLDYLTCTKRPQNFRARMRDAVLWLDQNCHDDAFWCWVAEWVGGASVPENVWIGVSAGADQAVALAIPARVHFLSCEPMLRPMDTTYAAYFAWIIFGGESDTNVPARACQIEWISEGIEFCRKHGIAPFVKQLGSNAVRSCLKCSVAGNPDCLLCNGTALIPAGYFKHKKAGDISEWPEALRVREFPKLSTRRA